MKLTFEFNKTFSFFFYWMLHSFTKNKNFGKSNKSPFLTVVWNKVLLIYRLHVGGKNKDFFSYTCTFYTHTHYKYILL